MIGKAAIREAMKSRRRAVTPEARSEAGRTLSRRLIGSCASLRPVVSQKGTIAVYLASKEEIDLTDFIATAVAGGCTLVAPRWNGSGYELVRLFGLEGLTAGPHWILEPQAGPVVSSSAVDAWLVPGLAFTEDGLRLGYGGGWYDRFLEGVSPETPKIGIAYRFQIVEELPVEEHDIRLTEVVTL